MTEPTNDTLTAEQIFAQGRQCRIKEVPYMGRKVYVHGFSRTEAQAYRQACIKAAGSVENDALSDERFVMMMVRDAAGRQIFGTEHLMLLADLNEADWLPLYVACLEVNGWGKIGAEAVRKNSEKTQPGASGSGSQPTTELPT